MILVTGATGTVGREVVAQLLAAGEKVRGLSRDPSKAPFDGYVEVVVGDLMKPETLDAAVAGVDRVFSLAVGPQIGVQEGHLAQASKKAGVRRIVSPSSRRSNKIARPRNRHSESTCTLSIVGYIQID